ncbi:MAG: hypothetical protein VX777_00300 [Chlamydiota bacterium]|nr:hypothetical protein [Chlamydiota bacterium]
MPYDPASLQNKSLEYSDFQPLKFNYHIAEVCELTAENSHTSENEYFYFLDESSGKNHANDSISSLKIKVKKKSKVSKIAALFFCCMSTPKKESQFF